MAIEAAGITTVCLSNMPDVTHAVGAPRVVGIESPFGAQLGPPGDRQTQLAVLRAALRAVETMQAPGEVLHLPFTWPLPYDEAEFDPPVPPPITQYLGKHPRQVLQLIRRQFPEM